jgi:hypothetical protein
MGKKGRPLTAQSNRPFNPLDNIKTVGVQSRDPRFDPLCGVFHKDAYVKAYSFIKDLKKNEVENNCLIK